MTDLWYNNPSILLKNMDQFFPHKDLTRHDMINAIARFAIYYSILIIIFNDDMKWLSISVIILIISLFLGTSETFKSVDDTVDGRKCTMPTKENPFMNYTVGDLITSPIRPPACRYDDVKTKMRRDFRSKLHSDANDMWGTNISDRNFYTMPNTAIVNDQMGFAKSLLGISGQCKTYGENCLKVEDIMYHTARLQSSNDMLN
jgi:hypothetical protein